MVCPHCGQVNTDVERTCRACYRPLPADSGATTVHNAPGGAPGEAPLYMPTSTAGAPMYPQPPAQGRVPAYPEPVSAMGASIVSAACSSRISTGVSPAGSRNGRSDLPAACSARISSGVSSTRVSSSRYIRKPEPVHRNIHRVHIPTLPANRLVQRAFPPPPAYAPRPAAAQPRYCLVCGMPRGADRMPCKWCILPTA